MPKAGVVPNCRYQHGDLVRLGPPVFPKHYLLVDVDDAIAGAPRDMHGIVVDAYECPVCGYTELFEKQ